MIEALAPGPGGDGESYRTPEMLVANDVLVGAATFGCDPEAVCARAEAYIARPDEAMREHDLCRESVRAAAGATLVLRLSPGARVAVAQGSVAPPEGAPTLPAPLLASAPHPSAPEDWTVTVCGEFPDMVAFARARGGDDMAPFLFHELPQGRSYLVVCLEGTARLACAQAPDWRADLGPDDPAVITSGIRPRIVAASQGAVVIVAVVLDAPPGE